MRPTYKQLTNQVKEITVKIEEIMDRISLADNKQELADLAAILNHYEIELMMVEDYIDRAVDRGRE